MTKYLGAALTDVLGRDAFAGGAGGGLSIVKVTLITASGTLNDTGTPSVLLDPTTTHVTGYLFGGGASGGNGPSTPTYLTGYDPEYGYELYSNTTAGAGGYGGGGGQIVPLPIIQKADLGTLPLSFTVGLGGARPTAPTALTNAVGNIGAINAGSDTVFGSWAAAGAPSATTNAYSSAPGWMTRTGLNARWWPRGDLLASSYATAYDNTPFGSGAVQAGGSDAAPGIVDITAPGGGQGGYYNPSSQYISASRGGDVSALLAAAAVANSTGAAPASPAASLPGKPFAGLPGTGGTGGAMHRPNAQVNSVAADGADGGFPSAGGGGGGHSSNQHTGVSTKAGRGGKGGDGCILLIELKAA